LVTFCLLPSYRYDSPSSRSAQINRLEGGRKHYLDAAIVRIMKAKKEMTYEQLKAATIDAVDPFCAAGGYD